MFPLCLKEAELGLVCWQDTLVLMKDAVSCYLFTLKKVCFWTAAGESSSESKLWPLSFPVSFDPSLPPSMSSGGWKSMIKVLINSVSGEVRVLAHRQGSARVLTGLLQ